MVANRHHPLTFFCGGSRNFSRLIDLFDGVFVLEISRHWNSDSISDRKTSGAHSNRNEISSCDCIRAKEGIPKGIAIDATAPLAHVVDQIVGQAQAIDSTGSPLGG